LVIASVAAFYIRAIVIPFGSVVVVVVALILADLAITDA
jgi:hypothetical protein